MLCIGHQVGTDMERPTCVVERVALAAMTPHMLIDTNHGAPSRQPGLSMGSQ